MNEFKEILGSFPEGILIYLPNKSEFRVPEDYKNVKVEYINQELKRGFQIDEQIKLDEILTKIAEPAEQKETK